MNKNKFLALAMAGTMMAGTLATATPVLADETGDATTKSDTTTVTMEVPTWNTYTLTVPAETALNVDGTAVELTNGIKVSGGTLVDGKKVTVTAASDWKMSSSDTETTFNYGLYATTDATATTTSWDFTQEEANTASKDAKAKTVYAKADADTLYKADAGTYSDVITFTAKVVEEKITFYVSVLDPSKQIWSSYAAPKGTTWREFAKENTAFTIVNDSVYYLNDYKMDVNPDDQIEETTYSL